MANVRSVTAFDQPQSILPRLQRKLMLDKNQINDKIGWEIKDMTITRTRGYGFGIAVSGGRDNPVFSNGDPSIAVSDVIQNGPAEGKLQVNDRIISANGISLECVDYKTAVQVLRDCGNSVKLLIKRHVIFPPYDLVKVTLTKNNKKDDFGLVLGCRLYIKEITNRNIHVIEKDSSIAEGDIIVKINNTPAESLSLKEAKKLIDSSKEKLNLVIKREHSSSSQNSGDPASEASTARYPNQLPSSLKENSFAADVSGTRPNWSNQNVYVQPPTRGDFGRILAPNEDNKTNIARLHHQQMMQNGNSGRNRGPITDLSSLTQLDQQQQQASTPVGSLAPSGIPIRSGMENGGVGGGSGSGCLDSSAPPRPPPPRTSASGNMSGTPTKVMSVNGGLYQSHEPESPSVSQLRRSMTGEPRLISFKKEGSLGIRLTGGNEVGIFVSAVQMGSAASIQGLRAGDKILKVNGADMRGMTREEAVTYLLGIQDQIDLIVQYRKEECDEVIAKQKGDSFHIRTHFKNNGSSKGELDFQSGEIFHVIDTLHNDTVGSWLVYRLSRKSEIQKGIIPNNSRAEEIAATQSSESKSSKKDDSSSISSRGSFFRRRSARRSKSLNKDNWEDLVFTDNPPKFSAYERVTMKHPGFIRPVVLFGPLADIARDKLLRDYPDKYELPHSSKTNSQQQQQDSAMMGSSTSKSGSSSKISSSSLPASGSNATTANGMSASSSSSGIVRLRSIREIIEKGKHALLDINPNAVNRLNYAQFAPIVIFLRAENKSIVKELRSRYSNANPVKSSRKLYENCVKLEKTYSHLFTSVIMLGSAEMWYKKLRETIEKQQQISIWMSETKPSEIIGDDFLFPMTSSRLSYASSPESDVELPNDTKREKEYPSQLAKASSVPSIATLEDIQPNVFGPPPYDASRSRPELNQAIHQKTYANEKEAAMDQDEYFNEMKSPYNSMYLNDPYSQANHSANTSMMQGVYGIGPPSSHAPTPLANMNGSMPMNSTEPAPRIDRANKPTRFRGMHDKLFPHPESYDGNNPPDYINTPITQPSPIENSIKNGVPPTLPDHHPAVMNGRVGPFMDSSSYSSDSYKYGSPSSTMDDRRYGSLSSGNSMINNRQGSDGHRYGLRNGVPQMNGFTNGGPKPVTPVESIQSMTPMSMGKSPMPVDNRPSPPPKPSNYQTLPVPPPKPMHYGHTRPWRADTEMNIEPHQMKAMNSFQSPPPPQHSLTSNMDMSGAPPAYYQTSKDMSQGPPRTNGMNGMSSQHIDGPTASYVNHSALTTPTRRIPYSDAENNNNHYVTGKNMTYDTRTQYSPQKPPSRSASMVNGGPYLNVPYPPRHRESINQQQSMPPPPPPSQQQQQQQQQQINGQSVTPSQQQFSSASAQNNQQSSHIDLSTNRENRGSAFELYRKPGDIPRGFGFHGLPPPPIAEHEAIKRYSTVSHDGNQNVVASVRGYFDHQGGQLVSETSGVSLVIPEGAIPEGTKQEIFFKVCDNSSVFPPLDHEKNETLLSPIVMCGPHGVKFKVPVELRLPHCGSVDGGDGASFALKLGDTPDGQPVRWQNVSIGEEDGVKARSIDESFLSVLLEHF
ncbi:tight junction protein 1-like isoform X2 [Brevipalpus obovatus]|uniref:tight junction protein 1-like isoform X2 n=1 Tax=Brevipalpus obovatus TaxID=246614 RepID=UPI003D9F41E5